MSAPERREVAERDPGARLAPVGAGAVFPRQPQDQGPGVHLAHRRRSNPNSTWRNRPGRERLRSYLGILAHLSGMAAIRPKTGSYRSVTVPPAILGRMGTTIRLRLWYLLCP